MKNNHKLACWMVVRDDSYYVDMAIKSVLPYVDGFYILDNGSADGTIEIIESFNSDKIVLEKIRHDIPCNKDAHNSQERFPEYFTWDEACLGNSLEAQTRSACVKSCVETFSPDWLIQIDADEVYTKLFFETLSRLDLGRLKAVQHSTDLFWGQNYIARQPEIWQGDKYDPHHRSWSGKLNVEWHRLAKNKDVIPLMMPGKKWFDKDCQWINGIVHIHLHRMFGPKSTGLWNVMKSDDGRVCVEPVDKTLFKKLCSNAKKVGFDWDKELPFVIEKWREWGVW